MIPIDSLDTIITKEEWRRQWKGRRESTSSLEYGLHFGQHYIAGIWWSMHNCIVGISSCPSRGSRITALHNTGHEIFPQDRLWGLSDVTCRFD